MGMVNNLLLPTNDALPQADGDPGHYPVVYVDRRGVDRSGARYYDEPRESFSERTGLHVCQGCSKYCEPVMTEDRGALGSPSYFCYLCDVAGRVRMLVQDGLADVHTAGVLVHRLIAFEHPGVGIERVTVIR